MRNDDVFPRSLPTYENKTETKKDEKRLQFLRKGIVLGIIAEAVFICTGDLKNGVDSVLFIDGITIVIFSLILLASFYTKAYQLLYHSTIALVVVSLTISLYNTSVVLSLFLMLVVVLVAYLLLSSKGGITWTFICLACIGSVYMADEYYAVQSRLDVNSTSSSMIAILLFSALLYVYEGINSNNEQLVARRDKELLELNNKLNSQLQENKNTSAELERTLVLTQKNNKLLRESKLALMNVLEDANSLQKQIQHEKENVEKIVDERTNELKLERARLRASLDGIGSGLLMTFDDDQEPIFNPAFLKLFELESNDKRLKNIRSKSIVELVQSLLGSSYDLEKAIVISRQESKPFHADAIVYGSRLISVTGAPIFSTDTKQVLGCVVIIEDKTESLMLERSKDEFISIASHELRTPLTAIRGNASMLVSMYGDELPNGDIKEMISDIKDASVRLIGIVNQFLSTSRLEQKRTVYNLVPVDLVRSIKTCSKELQELANEKKIKLVCDLSKKLPLVIADEARTTEIIINVIGNAIKYTNDGQVTITAKIVKNFVEVDVKDTGIGIDVKNQPLLFHKFQQTTSDILTRDDSRSTGLGLYITKLLIEQMGGRIYLKSSVLGKGSVFTFSLPIARATV